MGLKNANSNLISEIKLLVRKLNPTEDASCHTILFSKLEQLDKTADNMDIRIIKKQLEMMRKSIEAKRKRAVKENPYLSNDTVTYRLLDMLDIMIENFDYQLEHPEEKEKQNYNFVRYLIFEKRNLNYINEIFYKNSCIHQLKTYEISSLLEELIDVYLETIKINPDRYEILYYEKVIQYLLKCPGYKQDNQLKKKFLKKLLEVLNTMKTMPLLGEDKNRFTFFLEELIGDIDATQKRKMTQKRLQYKYAIDVGYAKEKLPEKMKLQKTTLPYQDMRDKFVVSIDSSTYSPLQLRDDAFSIEKLENGNYQLTIYTADVTSHLTLDSFIAKMAYLRAETIYIPGANTPMLPYEIARSLSLDANQDRFALAYMYELDAEMNCLDFRIERVLMKANYNLAAETCEQEIKEPNDIELYELLIRACTLACEIRKSPIYRLERAKKSFPTKPEGITPTLMSLTNHTMAMTFQKRNIPFIGKIKMLDSEIQQTAYREYIANYLKGLTIGIYHVYTPQKARLYQSAEVTNPIRKYLSFIHSFLIDEYILKRTTLEEKERESLQERLTEICNHINQQHEINELYRSEYVKTLGRKTS